MSDFSTTMNELRTMQQRVEHLLDALCDDIASAVSAQPTPGVGVINDAPLCMSVSASRLFAEGNWSPSTYPPRKQADAVRKLFSRCKTPEQLCKAFDEALREKRVKMSSSYGDYTYVNSETLRILGESELAKYIAETYRTLPCRNIAKTEGVK